MIDTIGVIREFQTQHFHVIVDALDDLSPDLSWDETGEVRDKLYDGRLTLFCARARVMWQGVELASDYLGGCIYEDIDAFQDHRQCGRENRRLEAAGETARCGSYFSDMISNVCTEARKEYARLQTLATSVTLRKAS
jgi:hypothetical protein